MVRKHLIAWPKAGIAKSLSVMAWLVVILNVATFTMVADAQITDPVQRKDWIYLHTLAKDIEELNRCAVNHSSSFSENQTKALWASYYRLVREFVVEIDRYIRKYSDRRSKTETVEAFRFRVWKMSLEVGGSEARTLDKQMCTTLF